LDLNQLEYFLKVASLEHMSKAAEELNISQGALSSNIRRLEAELGVELFTRKGRSIQLNDCGAYLYRELTPIIEQLGDTFNALRDMHSEQWNEIVIDAEPMYTFPGLLDRVYQISADSKLTLRNVRYPVNELFPKLLENEVDFAVMGIDINSPKMEKLLLSRDELVMLVHNSHSLAGVESAPLTSFAGDFFAVKEKAGLPASYDLVSEQYCKMAGFKPNVVFKSPSRQELVDSVRSRHYVMVTPINAISQYRLDGLSVIHISDIECYACLWMYWKKGKRERPQVQAVRQAVIDFYNERSQSLADSN
jgi:DNA-binding transcriptional LysR family regulator